MSIWKSGGRSPRYDVGRGTPVAWLVTLTKSRAIDRLRARAARGYRATSSLEAGTAAQVADLGPSPFETQADQELRIAVGAAVAGLPQAQQQAIELAYYEGLSSCRDCRAAEPAARDRQDTDQTWDVQTPRWPPTVVEPW